MNGPLVSPHRRHRTSGYGRRGMWCSCSGLLRAAWGLAARSGQTEPGSHACQTVGQVALARAVTRLCASLKSSVLRPIHGTRCDIASKIS